MYNKPCMSASLLRPSKADRRVNGAKLTFDQASGLQVIDKSLPSVSKSIQFVVKDTTAWMHVRARMRVCRGRGRG